MNEYAHYLYRYMLEDGFQKIKSQPEYKIADTLYNQEESALLETLTREQQEQFFRCKEKEAVLEEINLRYVFLETLIFLRGILFPG